MAREIQLLLEATELGWPVVEKDTNVLWTFADLAEADGQGRFDDEDQFAAPDPHCPVTSLFPGCMQQAGKLPEMDRLHPLAQTRHFVIFENVPPAPDHRPDHRVATA